MSTASRRAAQKQRARRIATQPHRPAATAAAAPVVSEQPDDEPWVPPKWPWMAGLVVCVLGLADASYLTYAHYTTALNLACSDKGFVDCAAVTTSSYSRFLGFPVAVLGLVFFAVMTVLMIPAAWRSTSVLIRGARLLGSIGGVAMILWLLYAELFRLGQICLFCTGVHILTFVLFVIVALGTVATAPIRD